MFDFTPQERKTVLFLLGLFFLGLGIDFSLKVNPKIEKLVKIENTSVKTDINQATLDDLSELPGVTPNLAKKIMALRVSRGGFTDVEELKEIKGVGRARYEKLKELFFVK